MSEKIRLNQQMLLNVLCVTLFLVSLSVPRELKNFPFKWFPFLSFVKNRSILSQLNYVWGNRQQSGSGSSMDPSSGANHFIF